MSATSIYFNGRMTRIPGSYSEVDASALESIGLSASGFVACIGTALGGKPYSAIDADDVPGTIQKSTRPGMAKLLFQDGSSLRTAEDILFAPSNEEDIQGAQRVYWLKVNEAVVSTATFNNGDGAALICTSADYGYHTQRINVQIGAGTVQGKKYIFTFDDTVETIDNVGGGGMYTLLYLATTPAGGYTTVTHQVTALKTQTDFTKTAAGLDGDITNQVAIGGYSAALIEVVSDDGGDDQTVTVYGVDGSGDAIIETLTVNGLTIVPSTTQFAEVHGARISAAPTGTVTVQNAGGGTPILTLTSVALTKALNVGSNLVVGGGVVTVVADSTSSALVTIVGRNLSGQAQAETLTLNDTTPVIGTATWTYIDYVAVGAVAAARTVTVSGVAVLATYAGGFGTLQKQADLYNSKDGFTFAILSGSTAFDMTNMDIYAATSILALATFGADLWEGITAINNASNLIVATRGTPGTGAPSNTSTPVFLAGGNEGNATPGQEGVPTADAADWQAAIDLLKKLYVNTIVMMTPDAAVHAQLKSHIAYMCGAGRMERDGVVGLMNAGVTGLATKAEAKTQIIALNTRHLRAIAQQCERYNATGAKTKLDPFYTTCIVAGMQAGSPVGTSETRKYLDTLGIYSDASIDTKDDAEDLIEMGLMFAEQIDGVGFRWVRNITTHLTTSNIAYTEASVNEAMNFSVYNFRLQMEGMVGETGFAGTVNAADGKARGILDELMDEKALTSWRSLDITLLADVMETAVEMSPVIPINFVKNYIHLYIVPVSAS